MRKNESQVETSDRPGAGLHRTVERVAAILDLAADEPDGVRMTEVAAELGAPKSSVHSLLRGLVAVGFLEERAGRYTIGPDLGLLALRAGLNLPDQAIRDELSRLSAATGETAIYGIRSGRSVIYIDAVESSQPVRYGVQLFARRPLFATSIGKAITANLPLAQRAAVGLRVETYPELFSELEEVFATGVAYNRQQTVPGVSGVAAPVKPGGTLVGGIAVAGPSDRLEPALGEAASAVMASAQRLGNAIESFGEGTLGRLTTRRSASRPSAQREQGAVQ
jgi:DNA-binding IclR family transcriptional regulator